jgi:low affinity Fe/Cu permease
MSDRQAASGVHHPDHHWFSRFARWTERRVGSPVAFGLAAGTIIVWATTGPLFGWSDTWQLVINTGTTIVTFLMVFLIQSTQTRDTQALHLKLDELIRVNRAARNSLLDLEDMTEAEIEDAKRAFQRLAALGDAADDSEDTEKDGERAASQST